MHHSEDFNIYATSICQEFQPTQAAFLELYDLNSYKNWYYDEGYGVFEFKDGSGSDLYFKYADVGSFSNKANTWMWSWDNESTSLRVKRPMEKVRLYGESKSFAMLTTGLIVGDEYTGWEMTAIAATQLNALGSYRIQSGHLYSYFVFINQITENEFETIKKNTIECDEHTSAGMAFVCQHLINGQKRGFHEAFESDLLIEPEDDYQAWCDDCEKEWLRHEEWDDIYKAFTDMKVVCEECYFKIKERNI